MPGADDGPPRPGSRRDFRAISPMTQPRDSGARLQRTSWARGGPAAPRSSPGWASAGAHPGPNEAATRQHRVRPELPAPRIRSLSVPPTLGGRLVPPNAPPPPPSLHQLHSAPKNHGSQAHATSLRWGDPGPRLPIAEREKRRPRRLQGGKRERLSVSQRQPTPPL